MRVTNSMLSNNFLYDLGNNMENMSTYQRQMSSGVMINKASDDPLGASQVMQIDTEMLQNKQYANNISDTTQWLSVTDTSLGQVNNVLQRINELLVSVGDAAYGQEQRQSIKDEINNNIGQLSTILNTSYDGKYVFGGNRGEVKPTGITTTATNTITTGTTTTTTGGNTQLMYTDANGNATASPTTTDLAQIKSKLNVEISQGVVIQYNVTAPDVLNFKTAALSATPASGESALGNILNNITNDLDNGNVADILGKDLAGIQDAIKNVSSVRTGVGALENRMTSVKDENDSENQSLTKVLANTDDVDYAQMTMQFSQAQTVYQASLQTSAKILQHTLIDYL